MTTRIIGTTRGYLQVCMTPTSHPGNSSYAWLSVQGACRPGAHLRARRCCAGGPHAATTTAPATTSRLRLEIIGSIANVAAEEWDAVATTAVPAPATAARAGVGAPLASAAHAAAPCGPWEVNPFVLHSFLLALESSGSAARSEGWAPCHLVLRTVEESTSAAEQDTETSTAAAEAAPAATAEAAPAATAEAAPAAAGEPSTSGSESGSSVGGASPATAGSVVGCCPLYIKGHSYGEFVFDQSWADLSQRLGRPYYPKLQACVPFTPCPGARLMVRGDLPAETRREAIRAMGRGLIQIAQSSNLSSVHVTFQTAEEWAVLAELGFLQRTGIQFHFDNRGYSGFDDFLGELKQSKRKTIRQERRSVAKQGLRVRVLTGHEITPRLWDTFYSFYLDTIDRYYSSAYLRREFFHTLGATMPEHVVMIVAEDMGGGCGSIDGSSDASSSSSSDGSSDTVSGDYSGGDSSSSTSDSSGSSDSSSTIDSNSSVSSSSSFGSYSGSFGSNSGSGNGSGVQGGSSDGLPEPKVVAAALNLRGSHALYGRNWGCSREYKNLHFELCYYAAVEHAISLGLSRVEAGAQGPHKLQRGYMPSLTYSSHYVVDPTLRHVVSKVLESERRMHLQQLQQLALEGSPFQDSAMLELLTQRVLAHVSAVNSVTVEEDTSISTIEEDADNGFEEDDTNGNLEPTDETEQAA